MRLPSNELEDTIDNCEQELLRRRDDMSDGEIKIWFRLIRVKLRQEIADIPLDIPE